MIGIIDWGIGGFGLIQELQKNGKFGYVYFSDSGYTPYGKVDEITLQKRVEKVIEFVKSKGADKIIIACNAAGSVIKNNDNLFNIVSVGKEIINTYNNKELTIIGGNRIISSGKYDLGYNHKLKATQRLSAIVEAGETEQNKSEILNILNDLKPSTNLFLGCTHYPALIPIISNEFPETNFIDPSVKLAEKLTPYISFQKGNAEIFTTGSTDQLIKSTKLAFGLTLDKIQVQKIDL